MLAVEVSAGGLNCRKCTAQMKEYRGCDGQPKQPFVFQGEELPKCPIKLINSTSFFYIQMYGYFEKGFLPFEGSILRQPVKILQAFDVIERERNIIKERLKNARGR